jgi:hypothetical protein
VSEQQPITWKDVEPAHQMLAAALGNLDTIVKRRGDLSERQAFRQSFVALNHGVESALNHLTLLHNRVVDAPPVPARPLDAVLADLVAEGYIAQFSVHSDRCYLSTWLAGTTAAAPEADWIHEDGKNIVALAEARLARVRERRNATVSAVERDAAMDAESALAGAMQPRYTVGSASNGSSYVRDGQTGAIVLAGRTQVEAQMECDHLNALARADRQRTAEASKPPIGIDTTGEDAGLAPEGTGEGMDRP